MSECIDIDVEAVFTAVDDFITRTGVTSCTIPDTPDLCAIFDPLDACLLASIEPNALVETVDRPAGSECAGPAWIAAEKSWIDGIYPTIATIEGTGSADDGHTFLREDGSELFQGISVGSGATWEMDERALVLGDTISVFNVDTVFNDQAGDSWFVGSFELTVVYANRTWTVKLTGTFSYNSLNTPPESGVADPIWKPAEYPALLGQFTLTINGPQWTEEVNRFASILEVTEVLP